MAAVALVMIALTGRCTRGRQQPSTPTASRALAPKRPVAKSPELPKVELRAFIYIDDDFVRRFGDAEKGGRRKLNDWLWRVEYYMQHGGFPVSIYIAGIDHWHLPRGALDGRAIFRKYVPEKAPEGSGANCMIALTGREGVYWSGISKWPRIFTKAQAAEPVDDKTVSVLCHEISHWFGAKDIIDAGFPERSVMNYRDKRFGFVNGRIAWDSANRDRMEKGIRNWRRH
jgi:hypothetical protein